MWWTWQTVTPFGLRTLMAVTSEDWVKLSMAPPRLQLRYTFQSGDHVITSVKVWNVPGAGHHAGKVDVKYWTGSDWEDVTNQSPEGFTNKIDTEEIEIKFDAVTTSQFRLDFWAHASAGNPTCVGATEVQIIGCKGP
ncbi:GLT1 [Symbiodinium sp. CCMP2456]|nr:GLT1 [Symbiodinium sp. CCMP2456]